MAHRIQAEIQQPNRIWLTTLECSEAPACGPSLAERYGHSWRPGLAQNRTGFASPCPFRGLKAAEANWWRTNGNSTRHGVATWRRAGATYGNLASIGFQSSPQSYPCFRMECIPLRGEQQQHTKCQCGNRLILPARQPGFLPNPRPSQSVESSRRAFRARNACRASKQRSVSFFGLELGTANSCSRNLTGC